MKTFFLSLKTTVWTLLGLIALFFVGAYMMPVHRELFGRMNDGLLFDWAVDLGAPNLGQSWWFFAALAALVLLTINTIVCSIQAIKGRWSRRDFLVRISPQIVHAGFLVLLLAHFLGAGWGYKLSGMVSENSFVPLPEGRTVVLREIKAEADPEGRLTDWSARIDLYESTERVRTATLGPNTPLFIRAWEFT